MMYAKLINGVLYYAMPIVVPGEKFIFKPTEEQLLEGGYLPVQYTKAPETRNGEKLSFKWVQTYDSIVQEWNVPKKQPTTYEVARMMVAQTADDNTALRMKAYYPEWEPGATYTAGYKVQHGGNLWRTIQAHTAQTGWEPENAASLWEQINETHEGTIDDAIPYGGNMTLTAGKYYTQNDVIYLCTRDTGNPVYHPLAELVGLYVKEI